jgi:hypothetical protein
VETEEILKYKDVTLELQNNRTQRQQLCILTKASDCLVFESAEAFVVTVCVEWEYDIICVTSYSCLCLDTQLITEATRNMSIM